MPSNYARGRSAEYKTMIILKKQGYVCARSAGSHGPADIMAASPARKRFMIQVKKGKAQPTPEEREELIAFARAFTAIPQIWTFQKPREPPKIETLKRK